MLVRKDEVLQDVPGVHARAREATTRGWLQKAQEDLEEV